MKTREFDTKNYDMKDIMYEHVKQNIDEQLASITHELLKDNVKVAYSNFWKSAIVEFNTLTDSKQKEIVEIAKEKYEAKKTKSIAEYRELREQCDKIFYDDNTYNKLTPELENLFYCQAYTALLDFKAKKLKSKATSNSKYQVRMMSYSKIACD